MPTFTLTATLRNQNRTRFQLSGATAYHTNIRITSATLTGSITPTAHGYFYDVRVATRNIDLVSYRLGTDPITVNITLSTDAVSTLNRNGNYVGPEVIIETASVVYALNISLTMTVTYETLVVPEPTITTPFVYVPTSTTRGSIRSCFLGFPLRQHPLLIRTIR